MPMIQTECKGCGQKIKVPEDMAGKRARCPSCGDPVKIPLGSALASSPEPPPSRRPPSAIPMGKPVSPPPMPADNPFDFTTPAAASPRQAVPSPPTSRPASEAPPANLRAAIPEARLDTSRSGAARISLTRRLATYAAIVGSIAGACVVVQIGPSEEGAAEVLSRVARGDLTVERLKGALIGLIAGLLMGSAVFGLVGRSRASALGAILLTVSGGAYGAVRKGADGELSWFLVLGGTFLGAVLSAGLGALMGALFDLMRGKA